MTMTATKIHKFELAGLGKAPFRVIGCEEQIFQAAPGAPMQPGTCCDYCGTGIMYVFWITSADGNRFKVGSDCVAKTGDVGLKTVVDVQVRKMKRETKAKRDAVRIESALENLKDESFRDFLRQQPHPYGYMADKGLTMLDFCEFMFENAGNSGKIKACRKVESFKSLMDTPA